MKFAMRFFRGSQNIDNVNEIIIKYTKKSSELIKFVQKHPNQRIVADITAFRGDLGKTIDIFKVANKGGNFAIKLSYAQKEFIGDFVTNKIDFFFGEYCDSYDELISQLRMDVSDVYVCNELCFDLVHVRSACDLRQKHINIRCYPNITQTSARTSEYLDTFKMFFMRPEDVDIYSSFVDILEFYAPLQKQDVLYTIYSEGYWEDNLSVLILGLNQDIYSNMIAPGWAEKRTACQKKCTFSSCQMCDRTKELANTMLAEGISFNYKGLNNEHRTIQSDLQNESKATSLYNEDLSENKVSEDYSDR